MNQRNSNNAAPKTIAYLNVEVEVQASNGEWYSFKGGIPVTDKKASERGLVANPHIMENSEKVKCSASLNVITEEPKEVDFA